MPLSFGHTEPNLLCRDGDSIPHTALSRLAIDCESNSSGVQFGPGQEGFNPLVRYSFAHGGKDATPYPVDRPTYDRTIATLAEAVHHSHMNPLDKDKALKRLVDSQKA